MEGYGCYKHSALLEPGGKGRPKDRGTISLDKREWSLSFIRLELEPAAELDHPRRIKGLCQGKAVRIWSDLLVDYAKARWILKIGRRIREVYMVKDIEEVGGNDKAIPLFDLHRLAKGHVELPRAQTAHGSASRTAILTQ